MKILRIELDDVYGHRDTAVDLSKIDAAAVTGPNGVGKSKLLTAGPLWALYGKKAVNGDSYDDVVRNGAEKARATVVFALGGDTYRVGRTYSQRTKAGKSTLAFERRDGDEWTPVHDGSIREVEASIRETIGVDYDTLTTGSVQIQGEAGAFCDATASERLEYLSELLGVDRLRDAYTAAGRERGRLESEVERKQSDLEDLEKKRDRLDEVDDRIESLEEELEDLPDLRDTDDLEGDVEAARESLDQARDAVSAAMDDREKISDLKDQKSAAASDRARIDAQCEQHESAIERILEDWPTLERPDVDDPDGLARKVENIELRQSEIADGVERALDDSDRIEQLADDLEEIRAEIDKCRDTIADREQTRDDRLEEARQLAVGSVPERYHPEDWTTDAAAKAAEAMGAHFAETEGERDEIAGDLEDLGNQIRNLEGRRKQLAERREQLADQAGAIERRNTDVDESDCRECGLLQSAFEARETLDGLEDDIDEIDAKLDDLREQRDDRQSDLEDVEDRLNSQRDDVEGWRETMRRIYRHLDAVEEARSSIAESTDALDRLEERRKDTVDTLDDLLDEWFDLDEIDDIADPPSPAEEAREDLDRIDAELKLVGRYRDLVVDRSELEDVNDEIASLEEQIEDLADGLEIDAKKQALEEAEGQLSAAEITLEEARDHNRTVREQRSEIREQRAAAASKRETLAEEVGGIDDLRAEIDRLESEADRYAYARKFFDAAPRMIVGAAIPRIEAEANDVLADVFPGVQIEVRRQKRTKSGGTSEKVHLRVLRNGAEQAYASFSGGEKFLIAAAVRLGLSRAAAERAAGSPIDLLILDEGFGSLDAQNVGRIQSALVELTRRFEQVLAISHVEELRHTFGTTIELEPEESGGVSVEVA